MEVLACFRPGFFYVTDISKLGLLCKIRWSMFCVSFVVILYLFRGHYVCGNPIILFAVYFSMLKVLFQTHLLIPRTNAFSLKHFLCYSGH